MSPTELWTRWDMAHLEHGKWIDTMNLQDQPLDLPTCEHGVET